MMSVYMTEDEQVEMIKRWWNKYQNHITVILSILLLTVAGVRYWNWHTEKVMQEASTTYENMMGSVNANNIGAIQSYANQLVSQYPKTVYAAAANLLLAKIFVNGGDYVKAEEKLEQVAQHAKSKIYREVASLRLAQLYIEQKKYDKSRAVLDNIKDSPYVSTVNELKGDIYAAEGHYSQAKDAYHLAMEDLVASGINNLFLEMKSNALAIYLNEKKNTI